MTGPATSGWRRSRSVAAGLALLSLLAAPLIGSLPAAASPALAAATARAADLRHQVDSLQTQAEQASEHYDAVDAELGQVVTQHLLAQRALEQAQTTAAASGHTADQRVRSLYEYGGQAALYASVLQADSLHDAMSRMHAVRALVADDQANVAVAGGGVESAAAIETRMRTLARTQTSLEQQAAKAAETVAALLDQQNALLNNADAEVARIAEADRIAAEEAAARAFQAQLAAALAAQQAAGIAPAGSVPVSAVGAAVINAARQQLGKPYVWGATGPGSFDCSGLTGWAYAQAGVALPRTAAQQYFAGPHVAMADLAPGDLLFWATDPSQPATIHHVALYLGGGQMIAAPHTGAFVQVQPVYLTGFAGATRPDAAAAAAVPGARWSAG